jgi:penicillin-binding protein 1A
LFALEKFGQAAFTDGYNVYTTFDSRLQLTAQQAIWDGVVEYDSRHGYRGPEKNIPLPDDIGSVKSWKRIFSGITHVANLESAIVTTVHKDKLVLRINPTDSLELLWDEETANTLQPYRSENARGTKPSSFIGIFKQGDVIRLKKVEDDLWHISQMPHVQAALTAINPENGAVVAISGGSDFQWSKFNRATQALRQPGSSFKPFVYLQGLESGYTPSTLINDAPLVFHEAGMPEAWRPQNYDGKYLGPIRLRKALYESRNMISIRILQNIGVKKFIEGLPRFGFETHNMQPNLSLALGSHGFTPLVMANAYAVLANGGYKVSPFWVSRIEDSHGNIIFEHKPATVCAGCPADMGNLQQAERVVDERSAYMMDDMLKDVIRKGTGRKALALNRKDLAGKTGTTNGPTDVWFSGYSPTIATSVWVGFDENTFLGKKEFGGTAALPIWIQFMEEALKDVPDVDRIMPPHLVTRRVNPLTGQAAAPETEGAIFEIFRSNPDDSSDSSDVNALDVIDPFLIPSDETTLTEELF